MSSDLLRALPSVDALAEELQRENHQAPGPLLVRVARETIHLAREAILHDEYQGGAEALGALLEKQAAEKLAVMHPPRPCINATGVVLHTGLGRAPLSKRAADAVHEAASGYSVLEVSRVTGERQSRLHYVDELLQTWTGAEASLVVNNNAAAMFLCLNSLARGRKAVIARAEMVEIGGSFRLPDILAASGVKMAEIGTTNKVRISDYAEVIDEDTALIIKVHNSNYRIVGFTEYPSIDELVALGKSSGVPVLYDLGSGAGRVWKGLIAPDEPIVQETVQAGVDLLAFSGDKLLGGPQAGILVGRSGLLSQLKKSPLARAVRVDKMTLAALAATLELYLEGEDTVRANAPILGMVSAPEQIVRARAEKLLEALPPSAAGRAELDLCRSTATVGGGSVPGEELPSWSVTVRPKAIGVAQLAESLRMGSPSVFGYIAEEVFRMDLRTVSDEELPALAQAVSTALQHGE